MLREVKNPRFTRRLTLFGWRYHVILGKRPSAASWSFKRQRASVEAQRSQPTPIVSTEERVYWLFEDRLYWDEKQLEAAHVLVLVRDRERRQCRKLERAHAAMAADVAGVQRREVIPRDVRLVVFERDGGRCVECGSTFDIQYDHVIPFSMVGGASTVENLQILCSDCNRLTGASLAQGAKCATTAWRNVRIIAAAPAHAANTRPPARRVSRRAASAAAASTRKRKQPVLSLSRTAVTTPRHRCTKINRCLGIAGSSQCPLRQPMARWWLAVSLGGGRGVGVGVDRGARSAYSRVSSARSGRMFRHHRSPVDVVRELRLPRPEREAARAERRVEREVRLERDNEHSAERRAAAVEAEARRYMNQQNL